jgi:branched-chain amino acid transport system permease protein
VIFGFLPVILRPFAAPAVQWILYGGLMIAIVFLLPQGIVPAVQRWITSRPTRKGAGALLAGSSDPREGR